MDARATLLSALPIVLILTALAGAIVLFPQTQDIRNKAAEPLPQPTLRATPTFSPSLQLQPQVACSQLYNPVCGSDNITYPTACDANQAGATIAYQSACTTTVSPPSLSPSPFPTSTITPLPTAQ